MSITSAPERRLVQVATGVTTLALLLAPLEPRAEPAQRLAEVRQLVEAQSYGEARDELLRVLEASGLGLEEQSEVYRLLAECAAALRQPEEARRAFVWLIALQPDFTLPEHSSPLLQGPFEEARRYWSTRRLPLLRYDPPEAAAPGAALVIEPEVEAAEGLVDSVALSLRSLDGSYEEVPSTAGRFELPTTATAGSEVEVFLVARDERGNVVARLGSADSPLQIPVERGSAAPEGPDGGRPWYTEWWVWTIVGVAVAAIAVGVPVGILSTEDLDPCERALGQGCDATLSFGVEP